MTKHTSVNHLASVIITRQNLDSLLKVLELLVSCMGKNTPNCNWLLEGYTLPPIIMVQWRIGPYKQIVSSTIRVIFPLPWWEEKAKGRFQRFAKHPPTGVESHHHCHTTSGAVKSCGSHGVKTVRGPSKQNYKKTCNLKNKYNIYIYAQQVWLRNILIIVSCWRLVCFLLMLIREIWVKQMDFFLWV